MLRARAVWVGVAAVLTLAATASTASAAPAYAPLDRPGPALDVPAAKLAAALKCSGGVTNATREPVLLSPATGVTADQNYSWNYERAFNARGIPWCQVTMPQRTLGDIQVAAEYLVYSIRTMRARSGRKIAVMGHSQGGMSMRWTLRFWPDTRGMVEDVVGWAGSNHGTTLSSRGTCSSGCTPATWQQGFDSNFTRALNSRTETHAGISYTEVYTHNDEVVRPNDNDNGSSSLHVGAGRIENEAIQDICPADANEHLNIGTIDPVAYALAIDALEHGGPANPARISPTVCTQVAQPGVDPANAQNYLQILAGAPGLLSVASPVNVVGVPTPKSEPALRCYVFASCPRGFEQATCLNTRGAAKGTRLGPVRLGRKRARVRASLGGRRNRRSRRGLDRYCVTGGGILEVGYPTKRLPRAVRRTLGGRSVLALSSSRRLSAGYVRRGNAVRTARRRLHGERRFRVGRNVWYLARARKATIVVKARGRRVRAVGIAARSATRGRKRSRRLVAAWRL